MLGYYIIMLSLIPLTMTVIGRLFLRKPPKEINHFYGYRSGRSMRSQEAWDFAHQFVGKIWFYEGLFMLIPSIIIFILLRGSGFEVLSKASTIIIYIHLGLLLVPIPITEIAIKRRFNNFGKPI